MKREGRLFKSLAGAMVLFLTAQTFTASFVLASEGDPFPDSEWEGFSEMDQGEAGRVGQRFGEAYQPGGMDDFDGWSTSGDEMTFEDTDGEPIDPNTLFSEEDQSASSAPTVDELKAASSEDAATKLGSDTARQQRDGGDESMAAEAFNAGREGASRPQPDVRNDPALQGTADLFAAMDTENESLATTMCNEPTSTEGEKVVCDSFHSRDTLCEATHDYETSLIEHISGPLNISSCGSGCVDVWIGKQGNNYWSGGSCTVFEEEMAFRVTKPQAITSAKLVQAHYDDHMQIYLRKPGLNGTPGQLAPIWQSAHGWSEAWASGAGCERSTTNVLQPNVSIDHDGLVTGSEEGSVFELKTRTAVGDKGESYAKIRIQYDPTQVIQSDGWKPSYCAEQAAEPGHTATCIAEPSGMTAGGCIDFNGVELCESHFPPEAKSIAGISPFCTNVQVSKESSAGGASETAGEQSCTAALSGKSNCAFLGSECVEENADGTCRISRDTYECGGSGSGFDCDVIEDVPDAFRECETEYVISDDGETATYRVGEEETCTIAKKLTECTMERDVDILEHEQSWSGSGQCFDTKEFSYVPDKTEVMIESVNSEIDVTTSDHTSASISQQPSSANGWETKVIANGPRQNYTDQHAANHYATDRYCPDEYSQYTEYYDDGTQEQRCRKAQVDSDDNILRDENNEIIYSTTGLIEEELYNCDTAPSETDGYGHIINNDWYVAGTMCYREVSACRTTSPPQLNFTVDFAGLYIEQEYQHFPAESDTGVDTCIWYPGDSDDPADVKSSDDWTSAAWSCDDAASRTLPAPPGWGNQVIGEAELRLLKYMYADDPYNSPHTVSEPGTDLKGGYCWRGHGVYNPDTEEAEYWFGETGEWEVYDPNPGGEKPEGWEPEGSFINDHENPDHVDNLQYNTCGDLETRVNSGECTFVREECVGETLTDSELTEEGVTDAKGHDNFCYISTRIYDCGEIVEVPSSEVSEVNTCESSVRCSGEDCFDFENESSSQEEFAETASYLHAAEQMAHDMSCTGVDEDGVPTGTENVTCSVFKGDDLECKTPVGSEIHNHDCCEQPTQIGFGDYLSALTAMPKLDAGIMSLEGGNPIKGAYTTLRDPAVSGFKEITKPLSSAMDSVSGAITENITTPAKEFAKGVVDELGKKMGELTSKLAGGAAKEGAKQATGQAVASEGLAEEGITDQIMNSGAGQLMQTVSGIYTAYTMAVLAVQIIWACEEDEFRLATDKDLKKCSYVGDYCKFKSAVGLCMEKREAYCCFASPLSRIIQEQGRRQFRDGTVADGSIPAPAGANSSSGFGSAKSPKCGGLTVEQVAALDWENIDLSEWIGMLETEDLMPSIDNLTMDGMTGSGNVFDVDDGQFVEDRSSVEDRTQSRMNGLPVDDIRQETSGDLDFAY